MREQEREREMDAIGMVKDSSQSPATADLATSDTEDGTDSYSTGPGLLIFGAGSDALCTEDGCFVTFERG